MSAPLRLGILGAVNIARQFAAAARGLASLEITGVAARDPARARAFAEEFGIRATYPSYEALLADPAIDAAYVPLPNTLHAEWSIRSLDAGKHVLCEKPIAMSATEARAMFEAARRAGRHLVEGYPYRAQPQTIALRELLAEGAVGRLALVSASFGVPFHDPADIRLRPDVGGGAILDAAAYAFSFIRMVTGTRPLRVFAAARWGETGVDRGAVATLEFPGGVLGTLSCDFDTAYHRLGLVAGDGVTIETTFLNHPPLGGPPALVPRRAPDIRAPRETLELEGGDGFRAEAEAFAALVARGPEAWPGATPAESIDIAMTLEAIRDSARSGAPVSLPTD